MKIIPGTPAEVVSKIASGLPLVANARVHMESVPADEPEYPPTTGLIIHYDLKVEAIEAGKIGLALWEGQLLTGAVADQFAARGFDQAIGAWATLVTPHGTRRPIGGGLRRALRDPIFDAILANLAETIAARAGQRGLRAVHVSTVRGLEGAVVIQATTDTPKETTQQLTATRTLNDLDVTRTLNELVNGKATRFEGVFLSVADATGEPVFNIGIARATGSPHWIRPGLGVEMYRGRGAPPLKP